MFIFFIDRHIRDDQRRRYRRDHDRDKEHRADGDRQQRWWLDVQGHGGKGRRNQQHVHRREKDIDHNDHHHHFVAASANKGNLCDQSAGGRQLKDRRAKATTQAHAPAHTDRRPATPPTTAASSTADYPPASSAGQHRGQRRCGRLLQPDAGSERSQRFRVYHRRHGLRVGPVQLNRHRIDQHLLCRRRHHRLRDRGGPATEQWQHRQ